MNTVGQWVGDACEKLAKACDPDSARLDAELIASQVTGLSRTALFAFPESAIDDSQHQQLDQLLARRCNGEPIAYILGSKEFWSLPLDVQAGVLVPRPDTETLVEKALDIEASLPTGCIIELGTGSGAISVALAQELKHRLIVAVDKYKPALHTAAINIQRHGQHRVQLVQGDWLQAMNKQTAAMVIANPPYLASDDPHLPALQHEPLSALVSGDSGLEDIEVIIKDTLRVGKPGCALLLEHGFEQAAAVRSLLEHYTFQGVESDRDLAGHERISFGYLKGGST